MKLKAFLPCTITLALAFLFSGCATEPSLYTGETGYYAYTWEQELELGKKSDAGIVQQMGLYRDDELASYVDSLGQDLLSHSAFRSADTPELYRNTQFTFRVLDSPVVNAFALPGGYVYVTRGLLAHLENEAQLAVVLGHEITHVEARHASKQALKQQWGQIGLIAGAIIGEQVAENKEFAREMVNLGGNLFQLVTLKYGRDAERESDLHGVEYASKAGYAAEEGSAFFESLDRISEKSGQSIPSFMSTHPDPGEREQTIKQLAAQWRDQTQSSIVARERYMSKINGLVVGENPRNGYTDGNSFFHPDLKLQFNVPSGWKVQNESSAVYMAPPGGSAMLAFTIAQEETPLESAHSLQQRLKLEPTYAQEDRINGMAAYILEGSVTTQSGIIPITSAFIEYKGDVFNFLGYGSAESFPNFKAEMRRTVLSFNELNNQAALNVQPYRLEIVPAPRTARFRELLPQRLPPGTDEKDWAIMNQVEVDEIIERGREIKLPGQSR